MYSLSSLFLSRFEVLPERIRKNINNKIAIKIEMTPTITIYLPTTTILHQLRFAFELLVCSSQNLQRLL